MIFVLNTKPWDICGIGSTTCVHSFKIKRTDVVFDVELHTEVQNAPRQGTPWSAGCTSSWWWSRRWCRWWFHTEKALGCPSRNTKGSTFCSNGQLRLRVSIIYFELILIWEMPSQRLSEGRLGPSHLPEMWPANGRIINMSLPSPKAAEQIHRPPWASIIIPSKEPLW